MTRAVLLLAGLLASRPLCGPPRRHPARSVEGHDRAVNNGERLPPHANARCVTAEHAADLADTFSPRFGVNTSCERTHYEKSEQKLTWRLQCRGQVNMDSAAEFTFFSPLRYTATITTKGWMGDRQIIDSQVRARR